MAEATIHVTGNLSADGELSYHSNGVPIMKFSIPVQRGGKEKPTSWYSVSWMTKKLESEKFAALFKKGSVWSVVGEFQPNTTEQGKTFLNVYAFSAEPHFTRVPKEESDSEF